MYTVSNSAILSNIIIVKAVFSFPSKRLLIIAVELNVSALGLLFCTKEFRPFFITGSANEIVESIL